MQSAPLVISVFLLSCGLTVALILRRPYLRIRVWRRHLRLETYFLGALLGPGLLFALGLLSWTELAAGLNGTPRLQPMGILALFFSMVFISIFLDITGVFEFAARVALRAAAGDGRRLFFSLYGTVALLTIFTSNDIIILTFTPLVYYFTRHARLDPAPYLFAEFFAANTWSMLLYIGNPTNIVLADAFDLTFAGYARWMALPTAAAGLVSLLGLYLVFRRAIRMPLSPQRLGPPREAITDGPGALLGLILLALCIIALAVAPLVGLTLWVVALSAALGLLTVLIIRRSWARLLCRDLARYGGTGVRQTLSRMPWPMIPFILSLFVMVGALQRCGLIHALGVWLPSSKLENTSFVVWVFGVGSALAANLLNNIPMTLAATALIDGMAEPSMSVAAFATTVGANLGANLTPFGALAGLMWLSILRDKEVNLRFRHFVALGLLITPWSLAAALTVLAWQFA